MQESFVSRCDLFECYAVICLQHIQTDIHSKRGKHLFKPIGKIHKMLRNWGYYCRRWWLYLGKIWAFLFYYLFFIFYPPPSSPLSLSVFCRILIGYHLFTCKKLNLSNWIKYTNLSRTYDVFTCLPNARCLPSANTQYTNAFLLLFSLAWGSHSPWANDFKICLWVSALYIAMFVCLVYSKSLCNQTISNYVFYLFAGCALCMQWILIGFRGIPQYFDLPWMNIRSRLQQLIHYAAATLLLLYTFCFE